MPHSAATPASQLGSVASRYSHPLARPRRGLERLSQVAKSSGSAKPLLVNLKTNLTKEPLLPTESPEVDGTWGPGSRRDERLARLEAVLFLAKEPLHARKLSKFADLADGTEAMTLVGRLNDLYDRSARSFRVEEVAGGWQLRTRPQFGSWLRRLQHVPRELRLSAPSLETLAVVAYRQPVVRAEIEEIRGVACGEILRQLMERDLVRVSGRSEELGRPYLYSTTKKFLQSFGLRGLDELPRAEAFRKSLAETPASESDHSTEPGDEKVAVVFEKDQLIDVIEDASDAGPATALLEEDAPKKPRRKKTLRAEDDDEDEWDDDDLEGDEEWEDGEEDWDDDSDEEWDEEEVDEEEVDDDDVDDFEYEYEEDDDELEGDDEWEEVDDEDVGDFEDDEEDEWD
ncbi:MAG: SMC-Scp complex subunit ScpB [Planctomycetota bacterium]